MSISELIFIFYLGVSASQPAPVEDREVGVIGVCNSPSSRWAGHITQEYRTPHKSLIIRVVNCWSA